MGQSDWGGGWGGKVGKDRPSTSSGRTCRLQKKFIFHSTFNYKHRRVLNRCSNLIYVFKDLSNSSAKKDLNGGARKEAWGSIVWL